MKPAVGIIIRGLVLGGAEKQSLILANLLQDHFPVFLFVQKKTGRLKQHLDYIEKNNINYIQLSGSLISRTIQLVRFSKKNNIRVIYAYLTLDNILVSFASLFNRIEYVGGIRNCLLPYHKYFITKMLQRFFFRFVIFNNQNGLESFIKKGFLKSKAVLVHNCIKIDESDRKIVRDNKEKTTILSIGRFTEQKDYYSALKAIHILNNEYQLSNKIEYIIVGNGELLAQIKSWITELKLDNVKIVITPNNIVNYYLKADIYLMTSIFEGLPNTIMEAQKYSLPVVTTDVGDNSILVKDGINGFVSEKGDPEVIAKNLDVLVKDYDKRIQYGRSGFASIEKNFSEEKFLNTYIKLTKLLMQDKPEKNEA